LVALAPETSRHRPDWTFAMLPLLLTCHCWAVLPLQMDRVTAEAATRSAGRAPARQGRAGTRTIGDSCEYLTLSRCARGVMAPLLALEPSEIVIANRTAERAENLAKAFQKIGPVQGVGIRYISGGAFDLVINATSASLTNDLPPMTNAIIGPETVCYDMAYGKTDTPFVQWSLKQGCSRAVQGWGMLVEQAAESFRVWRGLKPSTAGVLTALKERALSA